MKKSLIFLTLSTIVFARTVSFQEALSISLENNKELQAKKINNEKSIETLKEANAFKKGKLKFSEQISRTNNSGYVFGMKLTSREATFGDFGFRDFLGGVGQALGNSNNFNDFKSMMMNPSMSNALLQKQPEDLNYPDSRTNFESKLTFDIPIYTGGKLKNAADMAKLQITATSSKYKYDKNQLGLSVLRAYNGAVAAKQFISMTQKAKLITNKFIIQSNNLYKRNLIRIIDVKQAKMANFSINTKIEEATNKFNSAISYLQFLTGDHTITDVIDYNVFSLKINSLNKLQQNAILNRNDYKWMRYNTLTMQKKIDFDSSDSKPMIGAHFEYGFNDNTFDLTNVSNKDYYLAAIGLNYTIFDGNINKIKRQKAKIDFLKTNKYLEYMRTGIYLEVKKNYLDLITQEKTLKQKKLTQKMAEDILQETENMFANNLKYRTNMMYLLMQLENMLKIQADVIMSEYEYSITSAKLKLSIGKSLRNINE